MRAWSLALCCLISQAALAQTPDTQPTSAPTSAPTVSEPARAERPLTSIPLDAGLPLNVRVGSAFNAITISENDGVFTSTIDLRLRWRDSRLMYPASETPRGFYEFRGEAAQQKLGEIWSPQVELANSKDAAIESEGLRIFSDGRVEILRRITGSFAVPFDATAFPFDKQVLLVEVASKQGNDQVTLLSLQDELSFSKVAEGLQIDGWDLGFVNIKKASVSGWYGEAGDKMLIGLGVARQPGKLIAPIFIPLLASLLIPLLAIWMNQAEGGEFKVEAFELANVIIGGLFAVIALNFTVNAEYKVIASGDNSVTRLFGLNYLTLAVGLLVIVLLFRFHLLKKVFGQYVQEQAFLFLSWAIPVLVFGTAATFFLVAMA